VGDRPGLGPAAAASTARVAQQAEQPGRIGCVERIAVDVAVWATGYRLYRVACEELSGGWVVVAGAEVVEAALGVVLLAGVRAWS
jgi:hypothetical protein